MKLLAFIGELFKMRFVYYAAFAEFLSPYPLHIITFHYIYNYVKDMVREI